MPPLDADQDRLEQALLNLVDNAIKYTPRGGQVTVSARAAATPRGRCPRFSAARPNELRAS